MASTDDNKGRSEEEGEVPELGSAPATRKFGKYRIRIPKIQATLFDQRSRTRRVLDFLKARPSTGWLKRLRVPAPLGCFRRTVREREEFSLSVPSPAGIRRRFPIHFIRRINWASLFRMCKEWLSNPMNIALLIWLICVAVCGSMLGLLMIGALDKAFPSRSERNYWTEINNQVLNGLFTLMSIYQHPILFHHLVMLCRWGSEDVVALRKIYCKNGAYRPHEWTHMLVVVLLLHITCFSQYALCSLYWAYTSWQRPEFLDDALLALGIAAPVFAGLYTVYSPLGREYEPDSDEESQSQASVAKQSSKLGLKLYDRRVMVSRPEWIGGLFDCWEDKTVFSLSFFCTFCVFGWNMERLGFGNMYVHIATFLLLCVAPFWILGVSALNVHNNVIADVLGITGMALCVLGLLYGGFWRIEMRKRFKLPGSRLCCGSASVTDYVRWMFCWSCALAQEVRTGNFYDVEDDSLYMKLIIGDGESQQVSQSSQDEDSPLGSPVPASILIDTNAMELVVEEEAMCAPVPPLIRLEDGNGEAAAQPLISPLTQKEDSLLPPK